MINYGSNTTKHNQPLVGIPRKTRVEQGAWWLKFLMGAISVASIGLAWIPGVTELGVVADVAINESISALQYGIATSFNGKQSVVNTILSFGTPLVGGAIKGAAYVRGAANELELDNASRYLYAQSKKIPLVDVEISKIPQNYRLKENSGFRLFNKGSVLNSKELKKFRELIVPENNIDINELVDKLNKVTRLPDNLIKLTKQAKNMQEVQSLLLGYFRTLNSSKLSEIINTLNTELKTSTEQIGSSELKTFAIQFNNYLEHNVLPKIGNTEVRTLSKQVHGEALQFTKVKPFITKKTAINSIKMVLNPANLARGVTNKIYRSIRKVIWKGIKYEDKDVKAQLSLFKRNGGVEVVSEWIMGYRVIETVIDKKLIEISFKTSESYNKHPVYVWASDSELELFISAPGETYLDVWAYSKGGKRLFDSWAFLKLDSRSITFIAHSLNVGQLRLYLGLVSNISKIPTNYHNYWSKLKKAAINNAIARSMRLVTKDYFGSRIVKKQFMIKLGKHLKVNIPKELERITTAFGSNTAKAAINGRYLGATFFSNQGKNVLFSASKLYNKKGIRYRSPEGVYRRTLSAKRYGKQLRRVNGIGKNFAKW